MPSQRVQLQNKDETTSDRSLELDDDLFVDTELDVDNENGPLVDLYVDKDKHTQTTDNGSSDEIIMNDTGFGIYRL